MVSDVFDEIRRQCVGVVARGPSTPIFPRFGVFVFIVMTASIIMMAVFYRNADRRRWLYLRIRNSKLHSCGRSRIVIWEDLR